MRQKVAIIIAESICVICPHCSEAQPNPVDGSEQWDADQLRKYAETKKSCCACGEPMIIRYTSKALVQ